MEHPQILHSKLLCSRDTSSDERQQGRRQDDRCRGGTEVVEAGRGREPQPEQGPPLGQSSRAAAKAGTTAPATRARAAPLGRVAAFGGCLGQLRRRPWRRRWQRRRDPRRARPRRPLRPRWARQRATATAPGTSPAGAAAAPAPAGTAPAARAAAPLGVGAAAAAGLGCGACAICAQFEVGREGKEWKYEGGGGGGRPAMAAGGGTWVGQGR